ncbi:Nif11-like leader peptide family natural product precursor [[Phormidium ambiguum] IAM M-71]|uniref:Nif11-like leader peptide family natural product n=1 Tax=[Phormidium ambiguum] IAM M-71 TaxID=454136 RepID=A0A1U7IG34_9CYAN|nr:Nif11-like leader peptide family natural product precursor [Phormidium ambiguum]OKH35977.1 Nif11-like leader peptide family natural product precursor [Phormidium ambiguum IAM M-71]
MTQECAARFFKAIQKDDALKAKLKATDDPNTFVKIAAEQGYNFTVEQLQAEIEKMSPEEMAAVINPGVGPRRHLVPR